MDTVFGQNFLLSFEETHKKILQEFPEGFYMVIGIKYYLFF